MLLEDVKKDEIINILVKVQNDSSAISDLLATNNEPKWYDSESVEGVLEDVEKIPLKEKVKKELKEVEPLITIKL
jgi:hypothetical protein